MIDDERERNGGREEGYVKEGRRVDGGEEGRRRGRRKEAEDQAGYGIY